MSRVATKYSALRRTIAASALVLCAGTTLAAPAGAASAPQVNTVTAGPWWGIGAVNLRETAFGVDDRGDATAVWLSSTSIATQSLDVVSARLPRGAAGWSPATTIEAGHTTVERQAFGTTLQLRLAVDGGGRAVAAWTDAFDPGASGLVPIGNGGAVDAARAAILPAGAAQWSAPATLGAGQTAAPTVAFGRGVATALWANPYSNRGSGPASVARLAPAASTWSRPASVRPGPDFLLASDGDGTPELAVAPSGAAIAAWNNGGACGELRVTTRAQTAAPWSRPRRLTTLSRCARGPQVAIGADGTAAVVWAGGGRLMLSVRAAGTREWSSPSPLGPRDSNVGGQHVAVGRRGALFVTWTRLDGGHQSGMLATRTSARARWRTGTLSIDGSTGVGPQAATDGAGDAALTWLASTGIAMLATRSAGAAQWSQPVVLGPADASPKLALSPAGRGVAGWPTADPGTGTPTNDAGVGSAALHAATFGLADD